ncbi:hypothetical protein ABK040_004037 [Willaertia magna]
MDKQPTSNKSFLRVFLKSKKVTGVIETLFKDESIDFFSDVQNEDYKDNTFGWRFTQVLSKASVKISETSELNETGKTDFERLVNFIVCEDEKLSRYWRACT